MSHADSSPDVENSESEPAVHHTHTKDEAPGDSPPQDHGVADGVAATPDANAAQEPVSDILPDPVSDIAPEPESDVVPEPLSDMPPESEPVAMEGLLVGGLLGEIVLDWKGMQKDKGIWGGSVENSSSCIG